MSFLLFGCTPGENVHIDTSTGFSTHAYGLSITKAFVEVDGEEVSSNEFVYGANVVVRFDGLLGLVAVDGMTDVGFEMMVLSDAGDTTLYEPDIFMENDPSIHSVLNLTGYVKAILPYARGESYTLVMHIWDK